METRSSGPTGIRGELIEYRILGARGLLVSWLSKGVLGGVIGEYIGTSYRIKGSSQCRI